MKKELLALTASLVLVSSMSASVNNSTTKRMSNNLEVFHSQCGFSLMAREAEPGDKRHGRGKDDGKGHKLTQQIAREAEPGDKRHGRGKDDGKGHKLVQQIAREAEPGDNRRGRGKDDGKGHKLV